MASEKVNKPTRPDVVSFLTPALIESQGKADREYLTHRVKLLLDAKAKHPGVSFGDLAFLAGSTACGQGCCCCCDTIVLPGSEVMLANR